MALKAAYVASSGLFLPSAWPTSVLIPWEKPMAGMNAMELMDSTMLVAASSRAPIRPTMKIKKVKAKISRQNCIEPGMPCFISRMNMPASNRRLLFTE